METIAPLKLIEEKVPASSKSALSGSSAPVAGASPATWIVALLIFVIGAYVRIHNFGGYDKAGFDEGLYREYVLMLEYFGPARYPAIAAHYLEDQRQPGAVAKLPPTRCVYIFLSYSVKRLVFGAAPPSDIRAPGGAATDPALVSLHRVSTAFSILLLITAGAAAWRMFGSKIGLIVLALVAVSPLQIHLAQHGFIDGCFAFFATASVWLLWENLRAPNHTRWLSALGVALALLVLAKESAIFVYAGLLGLIVLNRWARFGTVTPRLLRTLVIGPACAVVLLIVLAGGFGPFVEIFRRFTALAPLVPFNIVNGDGPWYRYLIELLNVNAVVFCLALTGLFTLPRKGGAHLFLFGFLIGTFLLMANLRYGINLRFTSIWELPLAVFAAAQIVRLARATGRLALPATVLLTVGVCGYSARQYDILFKQHPIYEPAPSATLRAVNIIKDLPEQARH